MPTCKARKTQELDGLLEIFSTYGETEEKQLEAATLTLINAASLQFPAKMEIDKQLALAASARGFFENYTAQSLNILSINGKLFGLKSELDHATPDDKRGDRTIENKRQSNSR
jgi:hypothetical protein